MVLVRIEDDRGSVGWGEVWCNYPSCGAEHRARIATAVIAPLLLGRTIDDPHELWRSLTLQTEVLAIQSGERGPIAQVIAGIDIALWDLVARRAGTPLWRLLGGREATIGVYASGLNPDDPESVAIAAREAGFRAFKLKVGFEDTRDEHNLKVLRDALGPDVLLMVDANQAWDLDRAKLAVRRFAMHELAWIEEPMRADATLADWSALAAAASVPLAAGENFSSRAEFDTAIARRSVTVLQPDIAKWGGFSACFPTATAIRAAALRYCPHYLGGGLGLMASAHLLAAVGGDGLLEIDVNENPLRKILAGPVNNVEQGCVTLSERPGLGIDPDLADLAQFAIDDHVAV